MLLDEYLNYLLEDDDEDESEEIEDEDEDDDDEEEVEEKMALISKLKGLDPFGKAKVLAARKAHKTQVAAFKKSGYAQKAQAISKRKDAPQLKKTMMSNLRKGKEVEALKKTGGELHRARKAMKWKKRGAVAGGLGAVGVGGFAAARRSDRKGQSL